MKSRLQTICILGGGSAGLLSALTLQRLLEVRRVVVVHSPSKPVIGVGESTTAFLPMFLHRQLAIDRQRFFAEVQPTWKLGIRFLWGPPETDHFNYPFGFEFSERAGPLRKRAAYFCLKWPGSPGPISELMDRDLSPCVRADDGTLNMLPQPHGYHIDNARFLKFMEAEARAFGVEFISATVDEVTRTESGDVASLVLDDGRALEADLFIDCSGFDSLLLGQTMGERFVDYGDTLFCDTAVVGTAERRGPIRPYTTAETMDHGWCWRIELRNHVTLGYVHSSQFCSADEARRELLAKKPELGDNLSTIRFPSGRYENYWSGNVVAIGNASGFVEPLESTALHVIAEQLIGVVGTLLDSDNHIDPLAVDIENRRFRRSWDAVRDFLAVHYKFNQRLNTPFWQHCREDIGLRDAQPIVDVYQQLGPHQACRALLTADTLVQFEGYLAMLIGQRVPTAFTGTLNEQDQRDWTQFQRAIADQVGPQFQSDKPLKC